MTSRDLRNALATTLTLAAIGCFPVPQPPTTEAHPDGGGAGDGGECALVKCSADCGAPGYKLDSSGCQTCDCNPPQCTQVASCAKSCGTKVDANGCTVCDCTSRTTSCLKDSECPAGNVCNTSDYCDPPPGCDPAVGCPAVCYGRCVASTTNVCTGAGYDRAGNCVGPADGLLPAECCKGLRNPCEGAKLDSSGACYGVDGTVVSPLCCKIKPDPCAGASWNPRGGYCAGPDDGALPAECCKQPAQCGDGSVTYCDRPNTACASPLVSAPYKNCLACFDPKTCERQCHADSDCDAGLSCQLDQNDPCNTVADCSREGVSTCQKKTTPAQCGDGSQIMCMRPTVECALPLVSGAWKSCYACFDQKTCERQCFSDSECDPGTTCQPDKNDPCNTTQACDRLGVNTCQKPTENCSGAMCDLYCPYGYMRDATGCELCKCNPPPACTCSDIYSPVCGADGVTYSNKCEASCHNARIVSDGACASTCEISCFVSDPVCGADGVTYNCGEADAKCHNTTVAYRGACAPTCTVNCLRADPVCGADGVTYSCGEPDAICHHTTVAHRGECTSTCTVTCVRADPVCGADGVTYNCGLPDAICHNTTVAYSGPCQATCNTICRPNSQVCGSDGVTYDCAEQAKCKGATSWTTGICAPPPDGRECKVDSDCPAGTACFRADPGPRLPPTPLLGTCRVHGYCETSYDCKDPAPAACAAGSWSCLSNMCKYSCGL